MLPFTRLLHREGSEQPADLRHLGLDWAGTSGPGQGQGMELEFPTGTGSSREL